MGLTSMRKRVLPGSHRQNPTDVGVSSPQALSIDTGVMVPLTLSASFSFRVPQPLSAPDTQPGQLWTRPSQSPDSGTPKHPWCVSLRPFSEPDEPPVFPALYRVAVCAGRTFQPPGLLVPGPPRYPHADCCPPQPIPCELSAPGPVRSQLALTLPALIAVLGSPQPVPEHPPLSPAPPGCLCPDIWPLAAGHPTFFSQRPFLSCP